MIFVLWFGHIMNFPTRCDLTSKSFRSSTCFCHPICTGSQYIEIRTSVCLCKSFPYIVKIDLSKCLFSSEIFIFDQIFYFCAKFRLLTEIFMFDQNYNFGAKCRFSIILVNFFIYENGIFKTLSCVLHFGCPPAQFVHAGGELVSGYVNWQVSDGLSVPRSETSIHIRVTPPCDHS